MPTNPAIDHLRANAEAEAARFRELAAVTAERLRQHNELMNGLPPAVTEIVGADTLRQLFDASDRTEAAYAAIDRATWQPAPPPSAIADYEIPF